MRVLPRLLLVLCCGLPGLPTPAHAEDPPAAGDGGTLHVPLLEAPRSLDPARAEDEASALCVGHVVETLYMAEPFRRPFVLAPRLAVALPRVSEDGLTWTIPLRADARFADDDCFTATAGKGRTVAAADVVFSWLRLMDAATKSPLAWLLEGRIDGLDAFVQASSAVARRADASTYRPEDGYPAVRGLRAVDERTLEVRLTAPFPDFGWVLCHPALGVLPPEAVKVYRENLGEFPVGTGPYRFPRDATLAKPVLVRNPTFREVVAPPDAPEGVRGRRVPSAARVEVTLYGEPSLLVDAFTAGGIDYARLPSAFASAFVDPSSGGLRAGWVARGVALEKGPRAEVIYDCFNLDDPVVGRGAGEKGRALRRAISLAVDGDWAAEHLYDRRVERIEGPVLPEFPEADPSYVNPWKRRADETMDQARERARKLLADAGMLGGQGVPVLRYDVADDALDEQFFVAFQRDLAAIGLKVEAHRATWQEQIRRQRDAKFQITGLAWGADWPTASNFLQLFHGPNRAPGPNTANFADPRFDELYARAERLPSGPERTDLYRKMQALVVDEAAWVFRYRRVTWTLRQPWLSGPLAREFVTAPWAYMAVDAERRSKAAEAPR